MSAPLAIDLFCGLGGWTDGLLSEGYRVVGFDIQQHVHGDKHYAGQLVIQDVLTLCGSQFKGAALIVASPPCQAYSYRAMPFRRAKAMPPPCNALFEACFRIQAEASRAAGRYVPMVVENVRGAQPWVGRAAWHYGSYYLWGDVPALMPFAKGLKNNGGSWFGQRDGKVLARENDPRDMRRNGDGEYTVMGRGGGNHPGKALDGVKQPGLKGAEWFSARAGGMARHGSRSAARRAASALIAMIPLPLSQHIARVYKP